MLYLVYHCAPLCTAAWTLPWRRHGYTWSVL